MPPLADVQSAFARALQGPDESAPVDIRPAPDNGRSPRFDVHRNNRVSSIADQLLATFPAVHRLTGAAFFRAACTVFARRHPPRSPALIRYGQEFGSFLDRFPPAQAVPYLGDVARLEWARAEAYHAGDAEPVDIRCLAAISPARLAEVRVSLHPSLRLLRSCWPVVSLWSATIRPDSQVSVNMDTGENALVIRPDLEVEVRSLRPGLFSFVHALQRGEPIREAAQTAGSDCDNFDLAPALQGLFGLGAVVSAQ